MAEKPPDWLGSDFLLPLVQVEGDEVLVGATSEVIQAALVDQGWRSWRVSLDDGRVDARYERDGLWVDVLSGDPATVVRRDVVPHAITQDPPATVLENPATALERGTACVRPLGEALQIAIGSFELEDRRGPVVGGWEIRDDNLLLTGRFDDGTDYDYACRGVRVVGGTGPQLITCQDLVFAFCGVERGPVYEVRNAGGGKEATELVARVLRSREPGSPEDGGGMPMVFIGEPANKERQGVVLRYQDEDPETVDWARRMAYRIRRDVGVDQIKLRYSEDAPVDNVVFVGAGTLP